MDFNDTAEEAAFRKEVRTWLEANATRKSDDKQSFRARNDDPELLKKAKEWQDKKAKAVIDEMEGVSGFTETFIVGPYARAISPARYAIERGDWKAAAELQVRPNPLPHVQAITHFARAMGAARRNVIESGYIVLAVPFRVGLASKKERHR